jgi:hypothetical protein
MALKTIGIVDVAFFGGDHLHHAGDELGGQCGQPIVLELGPAVLDPQVLPLDVARFAQPLVERGHHRRERTGRGASKKADYRHRLLLSAKGARHCHDPAQQQHQLTASHSPPPRH